MVRLGRHFRFSFVGLVFLACPFGASAESLLEAYRLALESDPRLASARLEHEATEQTVRHARAGLLPSVILEAEKPRNGKTSLAVRTL